MPSAQRASCERDQRRRRRRCRHNNPMTTSTTVIGTRERSSGHSPVEEQQHRRQEPKKEQRRREPPPVHSPSLTHSRKRIRDESRSTILEQQQPPQYGNHDPQKQQQQHPLPIESHERRAPKNPRHSRSWSDRPPHPPVQERRRRDNARRRRNHGPVQRRRRRHYSSSPSSSEDAWRKHETSALPRTGVVSEDDEATRPVPRHASGSNSVRDDTVGHFRGRVGVILVDRYRITRDVGMGTFGRVVECVDLQQRESDRGRGIREARVAIKIVRNVKRYYESALIEARILQDMNLRGGRGRTHCVVLHDTFTIDGHLCMVLERLGPSLYDFLKRHNYKPFPMICVQDFTVQLLEAVEFLHSYRLIHTDLKIENILLYNDREVVYGHQRVPESTRIKIIDFGGACYDDEKKSSVINTRQYRAPEVILGVGWSMPSDMWSVGCILMELYRGELLFATHDNTEHVALMERIIGAFPRHVLKAAEHVSDLPYKAFDSYGRHRMGRVLPSENASFVKKAEPLEALVRSPEDGWFLNLIRMILVIDPHERATAHECLRYLNHIRRDIVRCG